jgi:hypothetical protein
MTAGRRVDWGWLGFRVRSLGVSLLLSSDGVGVNVFEHGFTY